MRGGVACITLPAGYLGSSLIGALMIFCGFDLLAAKVCTSHMRRACTSPRPYTFVSLCACHCRRRVRGRLWLSHGAVCVRACALIDLLRLHHGRAAGDPLLGQELAPTSAHGGVCGGHWLALVAGKWRRPPLRRPVHGVRANLCRRAAAYAIAQLPMPSRSCLCHRAVAYAIAQLPMPSRSCLCGCACSSPPMGRADVLLVGS
jgi:hypothetical protein